MPLYRFHGIPLPIITGIMWQGFHLLPLYWFGCRNIYTNCAFKCFHSDSSSLNDPLFPILSWGRCSNPPKPAGSQPDSPPLAWLGRLLWYGPHPPSPISEMVLPAGRRSNDSACLHLWVCVHSRDGARWMKRLFCNRPEACRRVKQRYVPLKVSTGCGRLLRRRFCWSERISRFLIKL